MVKFNDVEERSVAIFENLGCEASCLLGRSALSAIGSQFLIPFVNFPKGQNKYVRISKREVSLVGRQIQNLLFRSQVSYQLLYQ